MAEAIIALSLVSTAAPVTGTTLAYTYEHTFKGGSDYNTDRTIHNVYGDIAEYTVLDSDLFAMPSMTSVEYSSSSDTTKTLISTNPQTTVIKKPSKTYWCNNSNAGSVSFKVTSYLYAQMTTEGVAFSYYGLEGNCILSASPNTGTIPYSDDVAVIILLTCYF
jgi:hypothetical protein